VAGQKVTGMASLKIAGVSRQVTISSNILSNTATQVKLKGEIPITMSDYGIAPPTAMFGSLKTGDDVVVRYEFTLNK
jgi:polyisoprenoid-binding protein YceI